MEKYCKLANIQEDFYNQLNWSWKRSPIGAARQNYELQEPIEEIRIVSILNPTDCFLGGSRLSTWQMLNRFKGHDKYKIMFVGDGRNKWNNWVPIKLNKFSWRMRLGRLPSMSNVIKRRLSSAQTTISVFVRTMRRMKLVFLLIFHLFWRFGIGLLHESRWWPTSRF